MVESVGQNVTKFKPGDEVFGKHQLPQDSGSYAEFVKCSELDPLMIKPANISHKDAGGMSVCLLTAFTCLVEHGGLKKGDGKRVLVIGASGGLGCWTVLLAKAYGAQVSGICSTKNLELVKSLGI
jgi:NADPH:quinone reductase-like Zn-dependent oxidoreductase